MHRETGTAKVNGARIYYEVAGEGETLVLVHAGIADSRMWEGQVAAFAERYRVVRYDLRGFGKTEMVEGPFSTTRTCAACWTSWAYNGRTSWAARWGRGRAGLRT